MIWKIRKDMKILWNYIIKQFKLSKILDIIIIKVFLNNFILADALKELKRYKEAISMYDKAISKD